MNIEMVFDVVLISAIIGGFFIAMSFAEWVLRLIYHSVPKFRKWLDNLCGDFEWTDEGGSDR